MTLRRRLCYWLSDTCAWVRDVVASYNVCRNFAIPILRSVRTALDINSTAKEKK